MSEDPNEFDPRDLKPKLWLRGDWGTPSSWPDKSLSGSGITVSQGTAAQQPAQATSTGANKPILRANGATRVDVSGMSVPTSATFVFVMSGMVGSANCYLASAANNLTQGLIGNYEGAQVVSWYNNGDIGNFGALPTDRSLHIFTVTQTNGSSLVGYLDGTQVFSSVPAHNLLALGSIFSGATLTTGGSDGDWAEVVLFDRVLAAGERKRLHRYLGSYYKIPVTLV